MPSLSAISTSSTCGLDNGSINASVIGGVSPYTFEWSNGETTEDIINIPAGNYILTVTDGNGCTDALSVDVANLNSNFSLNANITHNSSCTGGNGSINLTVSPSGNYQYIWSNGSTLEDISGLPAGTYSVTVSENTCSEESTYVVNNAANLPNLTAVPTPTSCNMSNGSIDASVTGGVPPYTYLWSNGATTEDLNNLPAGNYILTVTDANSCTNTVSANVTNNNPSLTASIQSFKNVTCFGSSDGTATALGSGGDGVLTYLWSNGATTAVVTNLTVGTYLVTVTDGVGCTATASAIISQPDPLIPNASATNETAFGANDGTGYCQSYGWHGGLYLLRVMVIRPRPLRILPLAVILSALLIRRVA
ncbi:MAG: SprB repeat-containing protein [Lewinellaceae bacterium]|nr:SprB repeat-containing protein [Lewinellaceae bacterium]